MPQLFQVLKCFECSVFQVHQTKKSNKWQCKLCAVKQSIKRHYGLGTAKECRLHVQKLNSIQGQLNEQDNASSSNDEETDSHSIDNKNRQNFKYNNFKTSNKSKWSEFVENVENVEETNNESMYICDIEVVLEVPSKRKKFIKPKSTLLKCNHSEVVTNVKPCLTEVNEYTTSDIKDSSYTANNLISETPIQCNNFSSPSQTCKYKIDIEELDIISNQDVFAKKAFVPLKINKDSKWAQFTEGEEEMVNELEENKPLIPPSNGYEKISLFSLCEENDYDDVLNI